VTVTLPWGEEQCHAVAALLLRAGHTQTELAKMIQPDSLVPHLGKDYAAKAGFLNGMAADVVGCIADLREERGEDDLGEDRDSADGSGGNDGPGAGGGDA
jgi:hypothetical protein